MSHAAARVGDIAGKAGDEVQMEVHHGLAGRRACVDADVVAVGMEFGIELGLYRVDELEHRNLFLSGCIEPGRDKSPRYDKRVAGRHGEAVTNRKGERVRGDVFLVWELVKNRNQLITKDNWVMVALILSFQSTSVKAVLPTSENRL